MVVLLYLEARIADPAHEEDHPRPHVAEQDEERVIRLPELLRAGARRGRSRARHHHGGGGGGLGALLVHLDEALVEHVAHVEPVVRVGRVGHAGEVGLPAVEGERHPQRGEAVAEGEGGGGIDLQPRQRDDDPSPRERLHPAVDQGGSEARFERVEAVHGVREHQRHGQPAALVGELEHLHAVGGGEGEALRRVHGGHGLRLRLGERERRRPGRLLAKGLGPVAAEVDGVGEHEACLIVETLRRDEVLDAIVRLLGTPSR